MTGMTNQWMRKAEFQDRTSTALRRRSRSTGRRSSRTCLQQLSRRTSRWHYSPKPAEAAGVLFVSRFPFSKGPSPEVFLVASAPANSDHRLPVYVSTLPVFSSNLHYCPLIGCLSCPSDRGGGSSVVVPDGSSGVCDRRSKERIQTVRTKELHRVPDHSQRRNHWRTHTVAHPDMPRYTQTHPDTPRYA